LLALALLSGCADKSNLVADNNTPKPATAAKPSDSSDSIILAYFKTPPWKWDMVGVKAPPPPERLVLRGDEFVPDKAPEPGTPEAELAGGRELYRNGDFDTARKLFKDLAENTKTPVRIAEEARYYQGECYRRQANYPRAVDTYLAMLKDFPTSAYREQAVQHIFDIANYWLDDTRKEMEEEREQREGKRWIVWPHFIQWDKSKPFMDEEGRAIEALDMVRVNDILGPVADKALFLSGSVKFFNHDYTEADHYFSELVSMYPNSPFAAKAAELGIVSKNLSTGGPDYDGRKCAEARILINTALTTYRKELKDQDKFLVDALKGVTIQQAEKDYKIAEFYRRTGHPGSAYFYYEIVRRRYPGTKVCDLATERMHELRGKLEKSGAVPAPAPTPASAPSGPQGLMPGTPLGREIMPYPRPATETAPAPRPLPGNLETAPQPRPVPPS
jgi:TolA-binding protein